MASLTATPEYCGTSTCTRCAPAIHPWPAPSAPQPCVRGATPFAVRRASGCEEYQREAPTHAFGCEEVVHRESCLWRRRCICRRNSGLKPISGLCVESAYWSYLLWAFRRECASCVSPGLLLFALRFSSPVGLSWIEVRLWHEANAGRVQSTLVRHQRCGGWKPA